MNNEMKEFAMYLTGHSEKTILQLYGSWLLRDAINPKEPETVHGNEAEKVVCNHKNTRRIFENHECCDCGQLMIL